MPLALRGSYRSPDSFLLDVGSLFLGLMPLIFLLIITHRFSKGFRTDDWPVKHCDGNKTQCGASGNMGGGQVLLEEEICISMQILSRRNHESILIDWCGDLGSKRLSTPAPDIAPQMM